MTKEKTRKVGRDAGNGKFIPIKEAEKRPKTTVIETVPVPEKKKKQLELLMFSEEQRIDMKSFTLQDLLRGIICGGS